MSFILDRINKEEMKTNERKYRFDNKKYTTFERWLEYHRPDIDLMILDIDSYLKINDIDIIDSFEDLLYFIYERSNTTIKEE